MFECLASIWNFLVILSSNLIGYTISLLIEFNAKYVFFHFKVHLVSEHVWCEDYLVRSVYLKNTRTGETRTVTQFHFRSWPAHGVPSSTKALLEFRRKVNKSYRGRSCPIGKIKVFFVRFLFRCKAELRKADFSTAYLLAEFFVKLQRPFNRLLSFHDFLWQHEFIDDFAKRRQKTNKKYVNLQCEIDTLNIEIWIMVNVLEISRRFWLISNPIYALH